MKPTPSPTREHTPTPTDFANLERKLDDLQNRLMSRGKDGKRNLNYDDNELVCLIETTFPNPVHCDMYLTWVHEQFMQRQMAHVNKPAIPASDYRTAVLNTDFLDQKALWRLVGLFDRNPYPYIGIGTYHNHRYRLKPMIGHMEPEEEWENDPLALASDPLVGVEIQGGSAKFVDAEKQAQYEQRKRPFSNRGTDRLLHNTHDLDWVRGDDNWGFAFLPLGEVWSISDDDWTSERVEDPPVSEVDMRWRDTGFVLGVTTNRTRDGQAGRAGEVWLLYNFIYTDPVDGQQWEIDTGDAVWGYLKREDGDGVRRAGFKIADSFEELCDGYQWQLEKFFDVRYRLSPANLFKDDTKGMIIVRQDPFHRQNKTSSKPPTDL